MILPGFSIILTVLESTPNLVLVIMILHQCLFIFCIRDVSFDQRVELIREWVLARSVYPAVYFAVIFLSVSTSDRDLSGLRIPPAFVWRGLWQFRCPTCRAPAANTLGALPVVIGLYLVGHLLALCP